MRGVGHYAPRVPSSALVTWKTTRAARVTELLAVHTKVGGVNRGRRYGTKQINWALTLRLAGEFQGFARDLHDLAIDHLVSALGSGNAGLESMLHANLTTSRQLDKHNAQPASLGSDFNRLGFQLWPALTAAQPRAAVWQRDLNMLNQARNAIAHAEDHKLAQLAADGYPMQLSTVKRWRRSLDGLAACMDDVVASSLAQLLGTAAPW